MSGGKVKKSDLRGKDLVKHYVENSEIVVTHLPRVTRIIVHGALAFLPILKNRKITGTAKAGHSFLAPNPDAMAKIKAMDLLWKSQQARQLSWTSVGLTIIMADQQRADRISVLETVQDWLEPSSKIVGRTKRERGWGVGLVRDDKYIIGHCYKSVDLGLSHRKYATIKIFPWVSGRMVFYGSGFECEE